MYTCFLINCNSYAANTALINQTTNIQGLYQLTNAQTNGLAGESPLLIVFLIVLVSLTLSGSLFNIDVIDAGLVAGFLTTIISLITSQLGLTATNITFLFFAVSVLFFVLDWLKGSTKIY